MNLKTKFLIFILIFLYSCTLDSSKNIVQKAIEKKDQIISEKKDIKKTNENKKNNLSNFPVYYLGEPYFIEGVEYVPLEDYKYNQNGLATFYGAELHNKKTINNSLNKVTELLARHKTLPVPSVVKITNLENGLSLIVKINDRSSDNLSEIQVSRKVAQLLRFYKSGIAKVNVKIMEDASKQLKIVTQSMNEEDFNNTIDSAPTEEVSITNLDENSSLVEENTSKSIKIDQPIELGAEDISPTNLFLKVDDFSSYDEAKKLLSILEIDYKTTIQNEGNFYSLIIGPIKNDQANNLVSSLISKGYKKTNIIIE